MYISLDNPFSQGLAAMEHGIKNTKFYHIAPKNQAQAYQYISASCISPPYDKS